MCMSDFSVFPFCIIDLIRHIRHVGHVRVFPVSVMLIDLSSFLVSRLISVWLIKSPSEETHNYEENAYENITI